MRGRYTLWRYYGSQPLPVIVTKRATINSPPRGETRVACCQIVSEGPRHAAPARHKSKSTGHLGSCGRPVILPCRPVGPPAPACVRFICHGDLRRPLPPLKFSYPNQDVSCIAVAGHISSPLVAYTSCRPSRMQARLQSNNDNRHEKQKASVGESFGVLTLLTSMLFHLAPGSAAAGREGESCGCAL